MTKDRKEQINELHDLLREVHLKMPDLRLCQLIGNIFGADDHYHRKDKELIRALQQLRQGDEFDELDIHQTDALYIIQRYLEEVNKKQDLIWEEWNKFIERRKV